MTALPVCVFLLKSSPPTHSFLSLPCATTQYPRSYTTLSPMDLRHHASVALSEASCSFGSENSVMSVLAG